MSITEKKGAILRGASPVYTGMDTDQITVSTSPTEIISFGQARGVLLLTNMSTDTQVLVSESSAVTVGDGYPLLPETHYQWEYAGAVFGIVASGTEVVAVGELKV